MPRIDGPLQISAFAHLSRGRFHVARRAEPSAPPRAVAAPRAAGSREDLLRAYHQAGEVRRALDGLKPELFATRRRARSSGAPAASPPVSLTSGQSLGLGAATAATLKSTAEVNATPTSYATHGPSWGGAISTSAATITGLYNGLDGSGTLVFRVDKEGVRGQDNLVVKVSKGGSDLYTINIAASDALSKQYSLTNGLTLQFGAGLMVKDDTFNVNVVLLPPSYSPSNPAWQGSSPSDAQVTIDGDYNGAQGTGALAFQVDKGGVHGTDDLRLKVYGPTGSLIDTLDILRTDPQGTEYALQNGLGLTLGAGRLKMADSFSLNVNHTVGTAVIPGNPFNGTRATDPEFEAAYDVVAGSFTVNGTPIAVLANDSITSVLARINQSAAGVTAAFNATTERIEFTANTPGSAAGIALANDTSGFLAATKLAGAAVVPGVDADRLRPLSQVARFAGVSGGTLRVNGVDISLNPAADSLEDILARIRIGVSNATAALDASGQKVTIRSLAPGESLVLEDGGGTGFFTALDIAPGTHAPAEASESTPAVRRAPSAGAVRLSGDALDAAAKALAAAARGADPRVRSAIGEAAAAAFGETGSRLRTSFGLRFDLERASGDAVAFSAADRRVFAQQMSTQSGAEDVYAQLFGDLTAADEGFVGRMRVMLAELERELAAELGGKGLVVNRTA